MDNQTTKLRSYVRDWPQNGMDTDIYVGKDGAGAIVSKPGPVDGTRVAVVFLDESHIRHMASEITRLKNSGG